MILKIYRVARWLHLHHVPVLPKVLKAVNRIAFGVVLPPSATIGSNVLLSYQGLGTVIHKDAVIDDDVTIASCVTIGGRSGNHTVPHIKKGAFIGTGAKVLGPVVVGEYASIGANAVVLEDIPPYAVAVGIPAKVIKYNKPEDLPDYRDFKGGQ